MSHGIRIRHFESPFLQIFGKIKLRSAYKKSTLRVHDYSHRIRLHHNVPVGWTIHQIHFILQSRTAAPHHSHPQGPLRTPLSLQQRAQLGTGSIQDTDKLFIAYLKLHRSTGGGNRMNHTCSKSNSFCDCVNLEFPPPPAFLALNKKPSAPFCGLSYPVSWIETLQIAEF